MKKYVCKNQGCGQPIPIERVYAALSRGHEPMYHDKRCSNTATTRNKRARKAIAARPPKRRRRAAT